MKRGKYEYYVNGITIEQLREIAKKLATKQEFLGKTIRVKNSITYANMAQIMIDSTGKHLMTILDADLFDVI